MKKLFALLLVTLPGFSMAAAGAAAPPAASPFLSFGMIAVFIVIFYLMIWRPQAKRQKEHKSLLEELKPGDEIVTSSGLAGKVVKIKDEFLVIELAENVEVKVQKHAVSATLVKGTLKGI